MIRNAILLAVAAISTAPRALHAQASPHAADVPLAPTAPWVAHFDDASCVLSRSYGTAANPLELAFRPLPGDPQIELALLIGHSGPAINRSGRASVTLSPSGQEATGDYREYTIPKWRLIRFFVKRDDIGGIAAATTMRFWTDREPPRLLALTSAGAAMATLGRCEDDLLRSWGFDPVALHSLKHKATPLDPRNWLTHDDYPAEAIRSGESGIVGYRVSIDAQGKPGNCAIVESSGAEVLDTATCALITRRAHFNPAIGADGQPAASLWSGRFRWLLPSD